LVHICKDGNMRIAADVVTAAELKPNSFFKGLTDKEVTELLAACTVHKFEKGDCVLHEKEASRDIFVILEGVISICKTLYAGDEKQLGVLGPGEFFGEMSFLDDSPRSASAFCQKKTTVLRIDKSLFDKLAARKPRIAYKIMTKIAGALGERLRDSNEIIEGIFSNPNKTILELKARLLKIQTMLIRR
jgi:CRP/FNR family cyclic AMP-dependent transcriptional regulator